MFYKWETFCIIDNFKGGGKGEIFYFIFAFREKI